MTKLKIKIKDSKEFEKNTEKNGVYLAEYSKEIRLLIFNQGILKGVMNKNENNGEFVWQDHHNAGIYKNIRIVKKLLIEIEV